MRFRSSHPGILVNLILLLDCDLAAFADDANTEFFKNAKQLILEEVERVPFKQQIDIYFGLANHEISQFNSSLGLFYFQKALSASKYLTDQDVDDLDKVRSNMCINGWNMGCLLLKLQDFDEGWKLFENGLQTPADGRQRWQRSLPKPFNNHDIPLWRGQSLQHQRLLLLEEQAIGDAMMFLTYCQLSLQNPKKLVFY